MWNVARQILNIPDQWRNVTIWRPHKNLTVSKKKKKK